MPSYTSTTPITTKTWRTITIWSPSTGFSESKSLLSTSTLAVASKQKSWVNTPNFSQLKKAGALLPSNNFELVLRRNTPSSFLLQNTVKYSSGSSTKTSWEGEVVWSASLPGTAFPSSLLSQARAKAVKKAKGSQFNSPVFLAEAAKSSAMIQLGATRIIRAALALRRGRFDEFLSTMHDQGRYGTSRASRALTTLARARARATFERSFGKDPFRAYANHWLEFMYGWKPLMNDVQNAVETLGDVSSLPDSTLCRARGKATSEVASVVKDTRLISFNSGSNTIVGDLKTLTKYQARCTWTFKPKAGVIPQKLGLTNPAEVVWELVPLSFVVDWFLPIGDYLSGFNMGFAFEHYATTMGERIEVDGQLVGVRSTPVGSNFIGPDARSHIVSVKRYPLNGPPMLGISDLYLESPSSVRKAISAIALLKQRFPRS